jgi:hypothetical protein
VARGGDWGAKGRNVLVTQKGRGDLTGGQISAICKEVYGKEFTNTMLLLVGSSASLRLVLATAQHSTLALGNWPLQQEITDQGECS